MTAMMAGQATSEPVLDQPACTLRTGQSKPARPAQGERCVAATVEVEKGLLSPRQGLIDPLHHWWGQPFPLFRGGGAHVHNIHSAIAVKNLAAAAYYQIAYTRMLAP